MPYYYITLSTMSGGFRSGVREHPETNIEKAYDHFYSVANRKLPDLFDFDCVMISSRSLLLQKGSARGKIQINKPLGDR